MVYAFIVRIFYLSVAESLVLLSRSELSKTTTLSNPLTPPPFCPPRTPNTAWYPRNEQTKSCTRRGGVLHGLFDGGRWGRQQETRGKQRPNFCRGQQCETKTSQGHIRELLLISHSRYSEKRGVYFGEGCIRSTAQWLYRHRTLNMTEKNMPFEHETASSPNL